MKNDAHRQRVEQGGLPSGTVRGIVEAYELAGERIPDPEGDVIRLTVTDSDVDGVVPGQVVVVAMPESEDTNFCLRDLASGFAIGGLDPVPEGSEVAFAHCVVDGTGRVEASSYDLTDIVRPSASPVMR